MGQPARSQLESQLAASKSIAGTATTTGAGAALHGCATDGERSNNDERTPAVLDRIADELLLPPTEKNHPGAPLQRRHQQY
jgi:hypothetical protein